MWALFEKGCALQGSAEPAGEVVRGAGGPAEGQRAGHPPASGEVHSCPPATAEGAPERQGGRAAPPGRCRQPAIPVAGKPLFLFYFDKPWFLGTFTKNLFFFQEIQAFSTTSLFGLVRLVGSRGTVSVGIDPYGRQSVLRRSACAGDIVGIDSAGPNIPKVSVE